MTRRRSQTSGRATEGGPSRRLPRGPILLAIAVTAAIAVVAVLVVLQLTTQDDAPDRPEDAVAEGRTRGEPEAPVTIIAYADYQCGHCKKFTEETERVIEQEYVEEGLVRLEFRNMVVFDGRESWLAAKAAECANDQGYFWEYHDKLFEEQRSPESGAFAPERLKRFAGEVGLDQAEFDACYDSDEHEDDISDEVEAGRDAGIRSTPWLIVTVTGETSGETVQGNKLEELREAIDKKLEEAGVEPEEAS